MPVGSVKLAMMEIVTKTDNCQSANQGLFISSRESTHSLFPNKMSVCTHILSHNVSEKGTFSLRLEGILEGGGVGKRYQAEETAFAKAVKRADGGLATLHRVPGEQELGSKVTRVLGVDREQR